MTRSAGEVGRVGGDDARRSGIHDWYEAVAEIDGERRTVQHFAMRSMASGGAFHVAYYHATQQAFLEAHERTVRHFGGVFRRLRYDNLKSAVKKVLHGHQMANQYPLRNSCSVSDAMPGTKSACSRCQSG